MASSALEAVRAAAVAWAMVQPVPSSLTAAPVWGAAVEQRCAPTTQTTVSPQGFMPPAPPPAVPPVEVEPPALPPTLPPAPAPPLPPAAPPTLPPTAPEPPLPPAAAVPPLP